MKIKFLKSIAAEAWNFDLGQVCELDEQYARQYIGMDAAEEVQPAVCPHCQGSLEPAELLAAALSNGGERATLPGARKRG